MRFLEDIIKKREFSTCKTHRSQDEQRKTVRNQLEKSRQNGRKKECHQKKTVKKRVLLRAMEYKKVWRGMITKAMNEHVFSENSNLISGYERD